MMAILPAQNPSLSLFVSTRCSERIDSSYQQILASRERLGLPSQGFEIDSHFGYLIAPLFELSDYLCSQIQSSPQWLDEWPNLIVHDGDKNSVTVKRKELLAISPKNAIPSELTDPLDELSFISALRHFRNQWMCRLIYLNLLQSIDLKDLTCLLSELADVCTQTSLSWLERHYDDLYGQALDSDGQPQSMIVIGMGKLGGGELNLSSDIDLIFAFREHGETTGGKKSITHQEYFTKLGQKLIQHLDRITAEGFVFRVDMRLRPYGQSGALVSNIDSLENYYQSQGRDWERYAMIKARVMIGNSKDIEAFETLRRPFVYRKYLDFSAITALRSLKRMITKEVQRKGIEHNVKLGQGGIREIEFIVQALQILHGGRDTGLQTQSLYQVLPYLQKQNYLPKEQVDELWLAYVFLRRTEHALQAIKDEQTHLLPQSEQEQQRLAIILGYQYWSDLNKDLIHHRNQVNKHFVELIDDNSDEEESVSDRESWHLLISHGSTLLSKKEIDGTTELKKEEIESLIDHVSWQDKDNIVQKINLFLNLKNVTYMQPIGQERLSTFFAGMMNALEDEPEPDIILQRTLPILEAVLRRTSYLVLLVENPTALTHLIRLNRESVWFSDMIANMPLLLDELLDAKSLFSPPDKDCMEDELRQILLRLPENDDESHMDALRRFRHSIILRIAACEITNILPLMEVSDHLTWLVEVLLDQVLQRAWIYLTGRHGFPVHDGEIITLPEMVLVGYGKSGGLELSYDSDLDLVFLHNSDSKAYTNGDRSIDNLTFYTRLGQRIIHMLTSFTSCGRLYEVDMRLRPSGKSGLLVTSFAAFKEYQQQEAWTWEHQALTRARVLSGNAALSVEFKQVRQDILATARDKGVLKDEVISMREKMRSHLDTAKSNSDFDLKQGAGGIIDIEFMVQYLVLAWSYKYPQLSYYSDNIRQIEVAVEVGVLEAQMASTIINAYKAYRSQSHRLALQKQTRVIAKETLQTHQNQITDLWLCFIETASLDKQSPNK